MCNLFWHIVNCISVPFSLVFVAVLILSFHTKQKCSYGIIYFALLLLQSFYYNFKNRRTRKPLYMNFSFFTQTHKHTSCMEVIRFQRKPILFFVCASFGASFVCFRRSIFITIIYYYFCLLTFFLTFVSVVVYIQDGFDLFREEKNWLCHAINIIDITYNYAI